MVELAPFLVIKARRGFLEPLWPSKGVSEIFQVGYSYLDIRSFFETYKYMQ